MSQPITERERVIRERCAGITIAHDSAELDTARFLLSALDAAQQRADAAEAALRTARGMALREAAGVCDDWPGIECDADHDMSGRPCPARIVQSIAAELRRLAAATGPAAEVERCERAVVEAAMAWGPTAKLHDAFMDACDALRAARARAR